MIGRLGRRGQRAAVLVVCASLLLGGCQNPQLQGALQQMQDTVKQTFSTTPEKPVPYDQLVLIDTPEQKKLREQTSKFDTVIEGAVIGALLGAGAGAALGGRNRGQAALIGAAAGAALGGSAGYYIGSTNQQYASVEQALSARTDAARREAAAYREIAQASTVVVDQHKRRLTLLSTQLRQREIAWEDFERRTAAMTSDLKGMRAVINSRNKTLEKMDAEIRQLSQQRRRANTDDLQRARQELVESTGQLEKSIDDLATALVASGVKVS